MRFALLGDHPDGRSFAKALLASRRHQIIVERGNDDDVEETLADPNVDACIVAVPLSRRLDVARRVLQSERHAAVVHPVDVKPDGAYELNMLQGDTHQALLPLLIGGLSSEIEDIRQQFTYAELLEVSFANPIDPILAIDDANRHPVFPGWPLVRHIGGDIVELIAFARHEHVSPGEPTLISGRFVSGKLFHCQYQRAQRGGITIRIRGDELAREFDLSGTFHDADDPAWRMAADEFDGEVAHLATVAKAEPAAGAGIRPSARLSWRDEIRCAELDDSAGRSLAKRRAMSMDFQEANEEVGFKGTMTLVGCGMLWLLLVVLVVAMIYPPLFWVSIPILFGFLAMQLLMWAVPKK